MIALIPARKGSKRFFEKNTRLFNGKPLITWLIEFALSIKQIDKIVLSSNDKKCINIAKNYKDLLIVERPEELATDNIKVEEALLYTIDQLEIKSMFFENLILLQPTNLCFNETYLKKGLELIDGNNYNSVQTYYEKRFFLLSDQNIFDRPPTQLIEPRKIEEITRVAGVTRFSGVSPRTHATATWSMYE